MAINGITECFAFASMNTPQVFFLNLIINFFS